MPYSTTRVLSWRNARPIAALVMIASGLAAQDPVKFQAPTIELEEHIITVAVSSNLTDFLAAAAALSDPSNWQITLEGRPVPIRRVGLNPRQRTVTISYHARYVPYEDTAEIPAGTLVVTFRPVPPNLVISTGDSTPKPPVGGHPLSRCFSFKLTDEKKKADIDITGAWQIGENAKPLYSWSVKATCPSAIGVGAKYGSIGPAFTAEASQQANADPDAMKASLAYRKDKPLNKVRRDGLQFNADFLSLEFERKIAKEAVIGAEGKPTQRKYIDKNSNVMWSGNLKYVNAWRPVNWTLGLGGFEAGRAISSTVKADSQSRERQAVSRLVFDLDLNRPLFVAGKRVLDLHGNHTLRLPFRPEPFQRVGENGGEVYLTNKPRHWTVVEANWLVAKGAQLSFQYKRGSLPPSFEFVGHQLTVGMNLLLKH